MLYQVRRFLVFDVIVVWCGSRCLCDVDEISISLETNDQIIIKFLKLESQFLNRMKIHDLGKRIDH
jgi:hypothetical protein